MLLERKHAWRREFTFTREKRRGYSSAALHLRIT